MLRKQLVPQRVGHMCLDAVRQHGLDMPHQGLSICLDVYTPQACLYALMSPATGISFRNIVTAHVCV